MVDSLVSSDTGGAPFLLDATTIIGSVRSKVERAPFLLDATTIIKYVRSNAYRHICGQRRRGAFVRIR